MASVGSRWWRAAAGAAVLSMAPGCGDGAPRDPAGDAAVELPVVFEDDLSSGAEWQLEAGPEVPCPDIEDVLCGFASATIDGGELRLESRCDAFIEPDCPLASAARPLEGIPALDELAITADFARLGGRGSIDVCVSGHCAQVSWRLESVDGGAPDSLLEQDVVLDLHEPVEPGAPFEVTYVAAPGATDRIAFEVNSDAGDISVLYTSIADLRRLEIRGR